MERIAGIAYVADRVKLKAAAIDRQRCVDDIEPMCVALCHPAGQSDYKIRVFDDGQGREQGWHDRLNVSFQALKMQRMIYKVSVRAVGRDQQMVNLRDCVQG